MQPFLDSMNEFIGAINGVIWADWVLYVVLGVGVLFTLWSGFCQYRALVHGTAVTAGKFDDKDDKDKKALRQIVDLDTTSVAEKQFHEAVKVSKAAMLFKAKAEDATSA